MQSGALPLAISAHHQGMIQSNPSHNDPSNGYIQAASPLGDLSPSWTTGFNPSSADSNFHAFDNSQAMAIDALDWETWDNHFSATNGLTDTPPELWNFDPSLPYADPNTSFMQWSQQL